MILPSCDYTLNKVEAISFLEGTLRSIDNFPGSRIVINNRFLRHEFSDEGEYKREELKNGFRHSLSMTIPLENINNLSTLDSISRNGNEIITFRMNSKDYIFGVQFFDSYHLTQKRVFTFNLERLAAKISVVSLSPYSLFQIF